jgi:hypothetical protein
MRVFSVSVFLLAALAQLSAQAPSFESDIEQRCTLQFSGQYCTGLGCVSQAIVYGDDKDKATVIDLPYPSSPDGKNLGRPEAVIAKALLKLGFDGWALENVSIDTKTHQGSARVLYHLMRKLHTVTKG